MNRYRAVTWKTRPTSVLCCVWRERESDDAIMKEGKAAMKLKIQQKKHLSVLKVWCGVDLPCVYNSRDVGELTTLNTHVVAPLTMSVSETGPKLVT